MANWTTIARDDELRPGQRKLCDATGMRVALFRRDDGYVAIDNHCPHRGGPVGAGPLEGETIVCPWHGLRFDLASGACADRSTGALRKLDVRVVEGDVQVDLAPPRAEAPIHRYLVRYGVPGHVGRFGSIARLACQRGDRVVIATDRGQELGEVLVTPDAMSASDTRPPAGEVIERLEAEEAERTAAELRSLAAEHLECVTSEVAGMVPGLIVLDAELLFDRQTLVVYHSSRPMELLGRVAAELAERLNVPRVQFEAWQPDVSRTVAAAAGPLARPSTQEQEMRGPYERLKYDFRRVWECPVCRHRERTSGAVTSMFCSCQAKEEVTRQVPMKLIDDGPRRTDGKVLPPRKPTLP